MQQLLTQGRPDPLRQDHLAQGCTSWKLAFTPAVFAGSKLGRSLLVPKLDKSRSELPAWFMCRIKLYQILCMSWASFYYESIAQVF